MPESLAVDTFNATLLCLCISEITVHVCRYTGNDLPGILCVLMCW